MTRDDSSQQDALLASSVVAFYDSHPINEDEILAKLAARGKQLQGITEEDLAEFDQDHYGGTRAVDELARAARIGAGQHVLDVCSGMGGPARWLAWRYGCRVTGIDLTASRVAGANRLSERVRLAEQVTFVEGNATAMPFAARSFDAVLSQEAFCYIPGKHALLAECARVARPGACLAFTDIVTIAALSADQERKLLSGMAMPRPATPDEYAALVAAAGFQLVANEDLSGEWVRILQQRLEMYRSLKDTTVAKFGLPRYEEYDGAYAHYVDLFVQGRLGGRRIAAVRS